MLLSDTLLGALLLAFAAFLALYSMSFPAIPGQEYGAAVFPVLIAVGLAGCGLILLLRGVRAGRRLIVWSAWVHEAHAIRNVCILILLIAFYVVAADTLGFLLAMTIVLLVTFRILNVTWPASIVLALAVTIVMRWGFGTFLYVPLPRGVLAPSWL